MNDLARRTRVTRVRSTSKTVVTCADVSFEYAMWPAVSFLILLIGSTTSPGHGVTTGGW